jgi:hypothetical protein
VKKKRFTGSHAVTHIHICNIFTTPFIAMANFDLTLIVTQIRATHEKNIMKKSYQENDCIIIVFII